MENFDKENVQSVGSYEWSETTPPDLPSGEPCWDPTPFYVCFLDSTERIAIETAAAGADADSKDNWRTKRSWYRIKVETIRDIIK